MARCLANSSFVAEENLPKLLTTGTCFRIIKKCANWQRFAPPSGERKLIRKGMVNFMNRFWWAISALLLIMPLGDSFAADVDTGKEMYLKYCASCHGKTGRGDGAVSRDLKVKVPDLTLLRRNNQGRYPTDRVLSSIDGRRFVRAHGDRTMPVWGEIFRKEHEKESYTELTTLLQAKLIAEYVGTLQR